MNYTESLDQLIRNALQEDIGDGDHSTLSCIEPGVKGRAILRIKEDGILAGVEIAKHVFKYAEKSIILQHIKRMVK